MHFDTATRQRWMSVLAHSEPQDLLARMQSLQLAPEYELIRTPETGLVQLQARMGGICGGTAVFEGNTNYGKVEARGGGKGASEFSIGGISGMIAHDATGCRNFGDVLNNTGRENLLAHTGGLFGWATLAFTITDCALDADVVSTTLYNYDGDKGTTADPAHENSSCAGILVGRIKSKIEVMVESVKIYGKLTRTINAEGQTRTIDFTTTVPADNYLYGALQDAASKLVVGQGAITCVSTAK